MTLEEIKVAWLEALRSGRYEQGVGRLRSKGEKGDPDKYCCIGVLCDLVMPSAWNTLPEDYSWKFQSEIGLPDEDFLSSIGLTWKAANDLAGMNDGGSSFATIADTIETHWDKYTREDDEEGPSDEEQD